MYTAASLVLTPHIPHNLTSLEQALPLRWGPHRLYMATAGAPADGITSVTVDSAAWPTFTASTVTLLWASMPATPSNLTIRINFGAATAATPPAAPAAVPDSLPAHSRASALRLLRTLAPTDTLLWLDAAALAGALPDDTRVARWPDASGGGYDATQSVAAAQPVLRMHGADGGLPAVVFDGAATYLQHASMALPAESTTFVVFKDGGTANLCCTGVFFSHGGCNGLGTKVGADGIASNLMIDFSGSGDTGTHDLRGRQVIAAVVYNATGAFSYADTCDESSQGAVGAAGAGYMVGSRNAEDARYFNGSISEVLVFPRALNDSERAAVRAYLSAKWPPAGPALRCGAPPPNCTLPAALAAAAARLARFVAGMRAAAFADSRYELAHALLALDAVAAWQARCAGLNDGSITPLASVASEIASEAAYVASPTNLAAGLATVLQGYAGSSDPDKAAIYTVWVASA